MTTYTTPNGPSIDLDVSTVEDLKAAARFSRKPEAKLAKAAVELLRAALHKDVDTRLARATQGAS